MFDFLVFLSAGFFVSVVLGLAGLSLSPSMRSIGPAAPAARRAVAAGFLVAAGPFLFARELVRSSARAEWPVNYIFLGALVCVAWSTALGFGLCLCFAP